jgi:hypothetical protein
MIQNFLRERFCYFSCPIRPLAKTKCPWGEKSRKKYQDNILPISLAFAKILFFENLSQ